MTKKITPAAVSHADKVSKAMDLVRAGGYTWEQIAEKSGYASRSAAYTAVKRELEKLTTETADDIVRLELARLDAMQASLWETATTRSTTKIGVAKQVAATKQVLNIMMRRAKLLGLDDFERRSIELAERKHSLSEHQARITFEFMNRVMNAVGLTAEQRERLPTIIAGELERITDETPGQGPLQG